MKNPGSNTSRSDTLFGLEKIFSARKAWWNLEMKMYRKDALNSIIKEVEGNDPNEIANSVWSTKWSIRHSSTFLSVTKKYSIQREEALREIKYLYFKLQTRLGKSVLLLCTSFFTTAWANLRNPQSSRRAKCRSTSSVTQTWTVRLVVLLRPENNRMPFD